MVVSLRDDGRGILALRASKALRGFVEQDSNPSPTIKKTKGPLRGPLVFWLGERDSNPR